MAAKRDPRQLELFDTGQEPEAAQRPARASKRSGPIEPHEPDDELIELAGQLPPELRLGTSSWAFPGWQQIVYRDKLSAARLSKAGLPAYCGHPLFRTVGLDRTHYATLTAEQYREHAEQVPEDFRFLVKAHEACTIVSYPEHPRYGQRRGQPNDLFLDPEYATREVVEPIMEGLGEKAGPILFQVAPQSYRSIGGPEAFIERLHAFLGGLPSGPLYAVEVRNRELLTEAYAAALKDQGAVHCLNSLAAMPALDEQWRLARAADARALVVRWMVHPLLDYERAQAAYEPFDRLVNEDPGTRELISQLALGAADAGQPIHVIVNNKAEGSSPLSVIQLARRIAAQRAER